MQGPPGQPPFGGGGGGYGPPGGGGGGYGPPGGGGYGPPGGGGYGGPPQGGGYGGPPQGGGYGGPPQGGGYGGPPQGGGYGGPPQGYGGGPQQGFGALPRGGAPGGRAPTVTMSGGLYGTLYVLSMITVYVLAGLGSERSSQEAAYALPLPMLVLGILMLVFLSKMWASINDGQTKPTPGAAVGFLFIPLFSIYWVFVVWPGFASKYNAYIQRHQINAPPLGMGLILCAMFFGSVPVVGMVLWFLTFKKIANAVNALSAGAPQR